MRYKIASRIGAGLRDHNGSPVSSKEILGRADGIACHDDTVLNYAELPFAEECDLRGGFPRLVRDERGRLHISVEVDSRRKLTRAELSALRDDFEGQIVDGIGAGCFDALTAATGLSVQVEFPMKSRCAQEEGRAWKPTAAVPRGNERKIAAIKKLIDKMDKAAVAAPRSARGGAKQDKSPAPADERPNLKALFRLLAKPERDALFSRIKAELEASGNDLSSVRDGEYPSGNFRDPKLLRLLLNAGLPPETLDEKGFSLLYQAAGSAECIQLLLKRGVDVNHVCRDYGNSTALMRAAWLGRAKSVELLLKSGADARLKNTSGKTALDQVDVRSRDRKAIEAMLGKAASK